METIIGLVMIYAWVHATVIICQKTKGVTGYEQAVMIAGLMGFVLYIIGTI